MRAEKQLIGLQYLRGFVSSLVVLHHLYFSDTSMGPFGVKIFFVISGFVMWLTTSTANSTPTEFWGHRIIRIVPLYWFFLLVLIIAGLTCPNCVKTTEFSLQNVVLSFLFVPHFHEVQKGLIAPILIPGWSLNYEMFFYLVFGFALLVKSLARRALVLSLVFCVLVALGRWIEPSSAIASTYTNPSLLLFLSGLLLAMIYRPYSADGVRLGLTLGAAVILAQVLLLQQGGLESILNIAAVLIVAGAIALEPALRRIGTSNLLLEVGAASYSIYLSHLFFLRIFEIGWSRAVKHGDGELFLSFYIALSFAFAIAGGVAVHHLIERPVLQKFRRGRRTNDSCASVAKI